MSGVHPLLQALAEFVDNRITVYNAVNAQTNTPAPVAAAAAAAPAPADPFGLGAATPAPAPTVTPAMVQEVVMKLIHNEAAKAKLSASMNALGITELPATPPEKLPALYQAFKAIEAEFAGAPAAASGVTII